MKYKAKEAKQRLACPPWKTLGKLQLCHPDKNSEKELAGFTVQQSASPLSAHGWADCFLLSAQKTYTLLRQSADNLHLGQAGVCVDALLIGPWWPGKYETPGVEIEKV